MFGIGNSGAVQITAAFYNCIAQQARQYIKFSSNEREIITAIKRFS